VNPRVGGSHGDLAQALALAVAEQARGGSGVFVPGASFAGVAEGPGLLDTFGVPAWERGETIGGLHRDMKL